MQHNPSSIDHGERIRASEGALGALADAWLAAGATSFAVWVDVEQLLGWPPDAASAPCALGAPVVARGEAVAELRVAGLDGAGWRARLAADALLVGQQLTLDHDLEEMTAELVGTQDQLLALYDLSQSTRSALDVAQLMHQLAREAARLLDAEGGFVALAQGVSEPTFALCPEGLPDAGALPALFASLHDAGRPLVLSAPQRGLSFPGGVAGLLYVPVTIRGAAAGLGLLNKRRGPFNAPDLKLAQAIAQQAGAQLESALLYQESLRQERLRAELDLAAQIQLRLLPQRVPSVAGLEIAAAARPAREVGGDFYDFIARPGQPLVFAVGDVSGKGMSAALLMTMTRTLLRSAAGALPPPAPEGAMARLNEALYDDFTEVEAFATIFLGQYDPARRTLTVANAGHSPVIYRPAGGGATLLQADGVPVGVLPDSMCEDQALALGPGDLLVAATDGLSEAFSPSGELFGYDRLLRLVEELAPRPAQAIVAGLLAAVEQFAAGHAQDDDQTVVVLKGT